MYESTKKNVIQKSTIISYYTRDKKGRNDVFSRKSGSQTARRGKSSNLQLKNRRNSENDEENNIAYYEDSEESQNYSESESESFSSDNYADLDEDVIEKVFAHKKDRNGNFSYFVKFKGKSYRECKWVFNPVGKNIDKLIAKYRKFYPDEPPETPYFPKEYLQPKRVIGHKIFNGADYYLVYWTGLKKSDSTWETRESIGDDKFIYEYRTPPQLEETVNSLNILPNEFNNINYNIVSKSGKILHEHQKKGLSFLINSWRIRRSVIIADEIGLGKTAQVSAFLSYLHTKKMDFEPVLIIAPLSAIEKWRRKIEDWSKLKVLFFAGTKEEMENMIANELSPKRRRHLKFDALITTSQTFLLEYDILSKISWQVLVFDKAHKLKSKNYQLLSAFNSLDIMFKVLITGTPVQNSIDELFTMLSFVFSKHFPTQEEFLRRFADLNQPQKIYELQKLLKPIMFRRMKEDLANTVDSLEEILIECPMSNYQKEYYEAVLNQNKRNLKDSLQVHYAGLNNVTLELRRICNHPYLFPYARGYIMGKVMIENNSYNVTKAVSLEAMINASGKLILLDKLLDKMLKEGHKVLIFTRMRDMIILLQEYFDLKSYTYVKIDSSVRGSYLKKTIDHFNNNRKVFALIIDTPCCGVGINLTAADRFIVLDSDWNPQNDIQAASRCHRNGETDNIILYRLITKNSFEKTIYDNFFKKQNINKYSFEYGEQNDLSNLERLINISTSCFLRTRGERDVYEEDIDVILDQSTKIVHKLANENYLRKNSIKILHAEEIMNSSSFESDNEEIITEPPTEIIPSLEENSSFKFTKKQAKAFLLILTQYGWSRAAEKYRELDESLSKVELETATKVFLKWLLDDNENEMHFPFVEAFVENYINEYEKTFVKNNFEIIGKTIQRIPGSRLTKIEFTELNHFLVATAPTIDDIPCPEHLEPTPSIRWTKKMDQNLMAKTNENGLGLVTPKMIDFLGVKRLTLTLRFMQIMAYIKDKFIKYNTISGGNLDFNNENVSMAINMITAEEHQMIIDGLINYGYINSEDFFKNVPVYNNSAEIYVDGLISSSRKILNGEDVTTENFSKRLTFSDAYSIVNSVDLVNDLSKAISGKKLNGINLSIANSVVQDGFAKTLETEECRHFLGKVLTMKLLKNKLREMIGSEPKEFTNCIAEEPKILKIKKVSQAFLKQLETVEFPLKINDNLKIVSLGEVVYDRPAYHTNRYAYCPGYVSLRFFRSELDPKVRTWYKSMILDGGDAPIFRVEMLDNPEVFHEGPSPSTPWIMTIKKIKEKKGKDFNKTFCSGPEYFGFANENVLDLIMQLPNIEKCKKLNYQNTLIDDEERENTNKTEEPHSLEQQENKSQSVSEELSTPKEDTTESSDSPIYIPSFESPDSPKEEDTTESSDSPEYIPSFESLDSPKEEDTSEGPNSPEYIPSFESSKSPKEENEGLSVPEYVHSFGSHKSPKEENEGISVPKEDTSESSNSPEYIPSFESPKSHKEEIEGPNSPEKFEHSIPEKQQDSKSITFNFITLIKNKEKQEEVNVLFGCDLFDIPFLVEKITIH